MFNEPYAEIPSGALGTWGCPGSPGGRVHLSPSPSICLTDSFVSLCLPLFGPGCLPAWTPVTALWGGGVHLSPFVSLHLSPIVSQPGCLARLSGSFVTLCLPSFVSRCLPAWMPGTALWVDGSFVSLCLPSFVWHGSLRFVSLHLSPVVSQPGCLARLSRRTDSLVSLCLPSFVSRCLPAWMPGTALQADGFTCLPWFPFICLPSLWVDGLICLPLSPFVCLPLSPSLDAPLGGRIHLSPVVSQPGCVALTLRGFLHFPRFCPFGGSGLPSALALASVIPCLVDVGDRVLCLPFIWTSISLGLVVGRLPCLSLATPCLFVQCLVIGCGLSLSLLAFGVPS